MSDNSLLNTKDKILNTLNKVDISSIKNAISDSTVNATQGIQSLISNYSNSSIIIGLILIVIVSLIIIYILYWVISDKIFGNKIDIIQNTNIPVIGTQTNSFKADITPVGNGLRRAYTFWIYISDMTKYSGMYKHVLHLSGSDKTPITSACPYIFLDKSENKLYVSFANANSISSANNKTIPSQFNNIDIAALMSNGILIPYVPLQRWVHIGIVINQSTSTTTVTCYVDGDISTIKSTGDETEDIFKNYINHYSKDNKKSDNDRYNRYKRKNYENLNLDTTGRLIVGGSSNDSINGIGFSGLISKFKSFNYDINQKDIYNDYNEGPVSGLLVKLGLGNYGIRNPIYKIS